MVIYGRVDVEDMDIQLKDKIVKSGFSATCKGDFTSEASEMYDGNGAGYPGWCGVDVESVSVDEWVFFDTDGNEVELSAAEKKSAEKQMIESVENEEFPIVWECL